MKKMKMILLLSCLAVFSLQQVQLHAEEKWSEVKDNPVYLVNDTLSKGWKNIENVWYYFNKDTGYLSKGWITEKGCWYYTSMSSGAMNYGWVASGDSWYYMNKSNGIMQSGTWIDEGANRFYLLSDGRAATGKQLIENEIYEFKSNGEFITKLDLESVNGWVSEGTKQYYYENGVPLVFWQVINENKYYFSDKGVMNQGVVDIDGKTYKFSEQGLLIKEVVKEGLVIEDNAYVYYDNGIKLTGWQNVGKERYYFDKTGVGIHGWFKLSDHSSYFVNGKEMALTAPLKEVEELTLLLNDYRAPKQSFQVTTDSKIALATQIRAYEIITDFTSQRLDGDYTSVFQEVQIENINDSYEMIFKSQNVHEVVTEMIKNHGDLLKSENIGSLSVASATYNQSMYWVVHLFKN